MEWIVPFLLGFLVFSAAAQLFWGYALSAIAEKDDQSDLMQVLAWIPVLQMAPLIVAGGGSVGGFLLGSVGLILGSFVLGLTSAFVGGGVGSIIGVLGIFFAVVVSIIYLGRIAWTTATTRNLSGWVGLLIFVPVLNFFVYPYIAFHDGWISPNKVGLLVGLVLTIGSTAPSFQAVQLLNEEGGLPPEFAALLSKDASLSPFGLLEGAGDQGNESSAGPDDRDAATYSDAESIKALFSMQSRFERLRQLVESPDLRKAERQRAAMDLVLSIDVELRTHRGALDAQTYQVLVTDLMQSEARIVAAAGGSTEGNSLELAQTQVRPKTPLAFSSSGPAAFGGHSDPSPAPMRPIPVRAADGCPKGTTLRTRVQDDGEEEWCQQLEDQGGLRHGWYANYVEGGLPESVGEYSNGLRVGVWTRFYPSGRVRAQAEFVAGLQHGWLLSFNEAGERTKAVRFDRGVAVR